MWAEKPRGEKGKKNKGKKSKKQLNMIYTKYYAGKTKRRNRGLDYIQESSLDHTSALRAKATKGKWEKENIEGSNC